MRLLEPISCSISPILGYILMNRCRATISGISAGHITPHSSRAASASAARSSALVVSRFSMISPVIWSICGCWPEPSVCCIRLARPSTNSTFTTFLVTTWWPECRYWCVCRDMLLQRSGSPSRNTRSQGTNTLSKKASASISSNRDPSGWSKPERPRSKLSRHRNFSPGASQGSAKAKDVRPGAPVGSRCDRAG